MTTSPEAEDHLIRGLKKIQQLFANTGLKTNEAHMRMAIQEIEELKGKKKDEYTQADRLEAALSFVRYVRQPLEYVKKGGYGNKERVVLQKALQEMGSDHSVNHGAVGAALVILAEEVERLRKGGAK